VLPGRGEILARQHYYRVTEANLGKFTGLVEIGTLMLRDPWSITCKEEANAYATALAGVFKAAIEGAGQKDKRKSKLALWWTQEYKDAYKAYLVLR
jgi:hypothetical protein